MLNGHYRLDGKDIKLDDIKRAYLTDIQSGSFRVMSKISDSHLNPNTFKRMSVRLATQLFSRSVAVGLRTSVKTGDLETPSALDTADFVEFVNNTFDSLNSKNLYDDNPNRRPLSAKNKQVCRNLEHAITVFKKIIKITYNKVGKEVESRPPCFKGMVLTIEAILQLYREEQSNNENFFLMTNNCVQDPLENFFSTIRQHNGFSRNPSSSQFRHLFTSVANFSFSKFSEYSNCEEDGNNYLVSKFNNSNFVTEVIDKDLDLPATTTGEALNSPSRSIKGDLAIEEGDLIVRAATSLEHCALNYVAGWAVLKSLEKSNCEDCRSCLVDVSSAYEPRNLLILYKTYEGIDQFGPKGLLKPSSQMADFATSVMSIYQEKAPKIMHKQNLLQTLVEAVSGVVGPFGPKCQVHKVDIAREILKLKLHADCKWISKRLYSGTFKPHQRLENIKGH